MKKFIAIKQYKVIESSLNKLEVAAYSNAEKLQAEKDLYPDINPWDIDSHPACFEQAYNCKQAIELLESIVLPDDRKKVTFEEADNLEQQIKDVSELLDLSGVDTNTVLWPKVKQYMLRPIQVREAMRAARGKADQIQHEVTDTRHTALTM